MEYWLACKFNHGKCEYVLGTDQYGYLVHTSDKSEAWKFYDFYQAMLYVELGYCLIKNYI